MQSKVFQFLPSQNFHFMQKSHNTEPIPRIRASNKRPDSRQKLEEDLIYSLLMALQTC